MLMQVQNGYKLKEETGSGVKVPPPREKDVRPRQLQPFTTTTPNMNFCETVEDAAIAAAYKIAEAENKAFVAAEAVKEAERVSKMAEDADSMLLLAREILERCNLSYEILFWLFILRLICSNSYFMMIQAWEMNSCLWHEDIVSLMEKKCRRLDHVMCTHTTVKILFPVPVGYPAVRFVPVQNVALLL